MFVAFRLRTPWQAPGKLTLSGRRRWGDLKARRRPHGLTEKPNSLVAVNGYDSPKRCGTTIASQRRHVPGRDGQRCQ
jgi:hypothetical protein